MLAHNFRRVLEDKLARSRANHFGNDNYDEYRFGKVPTKVTRKTGCWSGIKGWLKTITGYAQIQIQKNRNEFLKKYENGLEIFFEKLNFSGQELLVDIIAYRLLGYKKIKLPRNNKEYWEAIATANSLMDRNDAYDPHFLHFILQKCDLQKIGYPIRLYSNSYGVAIDFILEQYAYHAGDETIVSVENGDVVLDVGACWGDTALYFACKAGETGQVYSFEFIPENIELFNINISLNPNIMKRIELIQYPVANRSGNEVFFSTKGPSSRIRSEPFNGHTGVATTLSIDDFAKKKKIPRVNFIKMDIEGAEMAALEGAVETVKAWKPKLAIAIYHSMDDFVAIPQWIAGLNLGYKLFLGHSTIHSEETVIFAKVEE